MSGCGTEFRVLRTTRKVRPLLYCKISAREEHVRGNRVQPMLPKLSNSAQPVAVIIGGLEYEMDDIARTETDVLCALENLACRSTRIPLRDAGFVDRLTEIRAQACFIVDPFYVDISKNGTPETLDVRVILEDLGLPYTGSPRSTAALCRDKILSKEKFLALGFDTPRDLLAPQRCTETWLRGAISTLGAPLILKPRYEGSGVGVSLCTGSDDLGRKIEALRATFPDLMIEEYIDGAEITVGVVGTGESARALPPVELELLESPIYDYETKRQPDLVNRYVPARLPTETLTLLESHAKRIHVTFGCSGVSRIDFRVSGHRVVAIEINASPSLSRDEHIPRSVRAMGWCYEDLIALILSDALRKT